MAETLAEHEVVRLAADLIATDTSNRGGGDCCERPAAEYAAARLAEAGLSPQLLEAAPGRTNVVARWEGTGSAEGALLLHGHLDVVPANPAVWSVPPFAGEVRTDELWGRGAVDMKGADAALLAVVRDWARAGRRPPRDVVIAFTADEEDTAAYGAQWLVDKHPELFEGCTEAIGESGGFTFHAGPDLRLYPIGCAERGTAWLRLTARGTAGHGSKPNGDNAVSRLAKTITKIAEHRWPVRLIPTVHAAIDAISAAVGADGTQLSQLTADGDAAALLDMLGPAGALVAATIRNSANPTMLQAGEKVNVIPSEAVGYVDGRVLAGYEAEFSATLDELTGPEVTWEYLHSSPALEAPVDTPLVKAMAAALVAEDPGGIPVPHCMGGGTDAKEFSRLGMSCYGFTPLVLPRGYDYYAMFHGVNERVPVAALRSAVRVLDRLLASLH
jgi:acetylornithine deacetylase/succinyl-diaminopimelate desuccinylase-like protein